ncbi:MAG: [acyl-carrier-protein] S-malonyltransferase [Planctomyces sp.]|nr:[acyl-carrier-protein] S-malonyltransferase [Planctomyces sp.]
MTSPRVLLFPGQGAQAVGMGRAWLDRSAEARAVMERADRALAGELPGGASLSQLCLHGPAEVLNRTDVSQPAILAVSAASLAGWLAETGAGSIREAGVVAAAGLSLGEYSALYAAGALSLEDSLRLVLLRGRAMQEAAGASAGGMVALIGASDEQAAQVCAAAVARAEGPGQVLVCANFNAPGQVVISGSAGACAVAAATDGPAAALGLRATPLQVAGAFHSPLMEPAAERLGAALERAPVLAPGCVVWSNVTAQAHSSDAASVRLGLRRQLTEPVRWSSSCLAMARAYPGAEFHEFAPGKTLAGLFRRIDRGVRVVGHDEPA